MDIATELENYFAALRSQGTDPAPLEAQALAFLLDAEFEIALKAFHLAANAPAYYATNCEGDFGSLMLEVLADACGYGWRKGHLYIEAKRRAATFSSFATSGGEGLARSGEVERIIRKMEDLEASTVEQTRLM